MQEIDGKGKTLRVVLTGSKYLVDYYQREYGWQTKHIQELLNDLAENFADDFDPLHERSKVESYGHYFLGSVIISRKENQHYIVDGQQRLTTLTLLLIYLYNQLKGVANAPKLDDLIYAERYGKKSFNLDVDDRRACLEALFDGREYDAPADNESVRNLVGRYDDIKNLFPNELKNAALPYFADWLVDNVHLVVITAQSDGDAYTIFETMNDRGLHLSPAEMFKGYLLANIDDPARRNEANALWKKRMTELTALDEDAGADSIKAWLRSQYAGSIRERKAGATPQDWDKIGTEFHRWVRDHQSQLGLKGAEAFYRFIAVEFEFYSRWYARLLSASTRLDPQLPWVFFNAQNNFTLQYQLLLAPLVPGENESVSLAKIKVVAKFVDILIARRVWNFKAFDYSTMQYAMFRILCAIRGKNVPDLTAALVVYILSGDVPSFDDMPDFQMHKQNRKPLQRLLARMTDWIEVKSGLQSHFAEYTSAEGKGAYEIEHIWANKPERHVDDFPVAGDFVQFRNRIGGLLLLPKSFNSSYGSLSYEEKLEHYNGQNLLARTLHPKCYEHNPGFQRMLEATKLPFKPYATFTRREFEERQTLYCALANQVWAVTTIADGT